MADPRLEASISFSNLLTATELLSEMCRNDDSDVEVGIGVDEDGHKVLLIRTLLHVWKFGSWCVVRIPYNLSDPRRNWVGSTAEVRYHRYNVVLVFSLFLEAKEECFAAFSKSTTLIIVAGGLQFAPNSYEAECDNTFNSLVRPIHCE